MYVTFLQLTAYLNCERFPVHFFVAGNRTTDRPKQTNNCCHKCNKHVNNFPFIILVNGSTTVQRSSFCDTLCAHMHTRTNTYSYRGKIRARNILILTGIDGYIDSMRAKYINQIFVKREPTSFLRVSFQNEKKGVPLRVTHIFRCARASTSTSTYHTGL